MIEAPRARLLSGRALRMRRPRLQPETEFLLLAAVVGAGGALGDALFRKAIHFCSWLLRERLPALIESDLGLSTGLVFLVPALGGLAIGLLSKLVGRELGGYGMPRFLERVNVHEARLSLREVAWRTLGAVITLGSGGSAGVEGPVATLGGGIGVGIGRVRRLVGERLRLVAACGSSAAIASAYGAPIAGVFFSQEIVLAGNYDLQNFVRVVVASGTATVVARAMRGDEPLFQVAPFELVSAWELVSYLALGVLCGAIAALFTRVFYKTQDVFAASTLPTWVRPALGGLAVGLLALAAPEILGDGSEHIQRQIEVGADAGMVAVLLLFVVCVAKVLATSLTIGSGGGGGVFGPSLFLGATVGVALGTLAQHFLPDSTGLPGHYALVGMGALLAGATRAPLTAIFLVFEMTGSSSTAVLPSLLAVTAAIVVARKLEAESIDEVGLARRGIHLRAGREERTLTAVKVGEAMTRDVEKVPADMPAPALQALISGSRRTAFIVVGADGRMVGLLTIQDLRALDSDVARELGGLAIAADLAEPAVVTAYPDESLAEALARMDRNGYRQLPVVARDDPRRVIGLLERRHVITAYRRALPGSSAEGR